MTAGDDRMAGEASTEPEKLCVISVPRALEERVIDWLLTLDDVPRFTSAAVEVHGLDPNRLRGGERVRGRQRRTELRVRVAAAQADAFLEALQRELAGMDVEWLVLSVDAAGRLR